MKHHPFTEYWPLLDGENFSKFKADIAINGLRMPILTYQDRVLDGRNRERACEETGVPARYEDSGARSDDEALMLVVSLNEHRRHLSEDERLFAAARLAQMQHGGDRKSIKLSKESLISEKVTTLEKAAKLMDVSLGSATRARTVLRHGTKEDEQDVISGKVSLTRKDEQVRNRKNGVHHLPTNRNTKKITITIPYEDVINRLRPLVKRVKEQSKRHAATVSFTELSIIAHELGGLADAWMKSGPESGTRSEPAPINRVRGG